MPQPTEAEVLAALESYGAYINDENYRNFQIISKIEAIEPGDQHILAGLDGGSANPDTEWRNTQREEYKAGIMEGLSTLECPTGQWEFPPDLDIVMNHIDSLEGGGIRWLRQMDSFIFWLGWGDLQGPRTQSYHAGQIKTGTEIAKWYEIEDEFDIAGGFKMGSGTKCWSHAFYSRPKNDESQGWFWRYGGGAYASCGEVFENMVEVLDWYKNFGGLGERDIREMINGVF
ncbi:putative FAD binding domain-containing protein [Fusarium austroafricanum]|uniref:Putative FAD binding domain-containing protein n=1 Tax=Fusarium austroafricanum TaxID=2364996 RepID=A0A8H4JEQ0_9HYPO|nr:putative FAD binding domain-containing protein [Fusarium austroafricanum]